MAATKKTATKDQEIFKCLRCGKEHKDAVGRFFKAKNKMYAGNSDYYPICQSCLNEKFEEYRRRYDERTAVMILCHYLDVPFYYSLYDSIIKKNDGFTMGMYMRQMNNSQYRGKTFVNTLLDKKELQITEKDFEEIKETKWTISQQKNRNEVINIVGYDPFQGYNEEQRKFLFSNIIGYLEEDGI